MPIDDLKTESTNQDCQNDSRLDHREAHPNADARPCAKWQVCISRARLDLFNREAVRIEGIGIFPDAAIAVEGIDCDGHLCGWRQLRPPTGMAWAASSTISLAGVTWVCAL